jgi:hypothetical protein
VCNVEKRNIYCPFLQPSSDSLVIKNLAKSLHYLSCCDLSMFETAVVNATRQKTRCHIPGDLSHQHHCSASLRSPRDSDVMFCKLRFVLRCVTVLLLHITALNFVLNWAVLVATQSVIETQILGHVSPHYCALILSTLFKNCIYILS